MCGESDKLELSILEPLKDTTLFYPCSGSDCRTPVNIFAPFVNKFLFVDIKYFTEKSAREEQSLLARSDGYEFLESQIMGKPIARMESRHDENGNEYPWIEPCLLVEKYRHLESGRVVHIHRRRGFGQKVLESEISQIGVFFYRGDSPGEGGSGTRWLSKRWLEKFLPRIKDGGLIVTDGSMSDPKQFKRFQKNCDIGCKAVEKSRPFTKYGRYFECIGYAGMRYGPTLIWKVTSND